MEDSIFSPGMYLDYMDELLLDGCWLETSQTEGSDFLSPNVFFDNGSVWPSSDSIAGDFGGSLIQGENEISVLPGNSHMNQTHSQGTHFSHNMVDDVEPTRNLNGDCITEASELSRRWWIGPRTNQSPSTSVLQSQRLASYRNISVKYQFSAEEDSKDMAGLPGHVFLSKIPEWTPDVRFFRSDEYPRVDHAQQHDVRGTFALPVFEQGSRTCLGVIEVVMTTEKIKIRPELETVCKALEEHSVRILILLLRPVFLHKQAVNLRSSIPSTTENIKAGDRSYQAALPEIKEVLSKVEGCRHSIENYVHCVSTVDDACYIVEPDIRGFHEACSEHHLFKGQGVAGKAFMTNHPCFSTDITSFKKTEYPLAHHARMFKLHAAVAMRLRCIHTGKADYVLEFFLPADCRDPEGKKEMLNSLSSVIQQVCCSLRVVTNKELEEETDLTVSEVIAPSDGIPSTDESSEEQCTHHSEKYLRENPSWTAGLSDVKQSSSSSTSTTTVHGKEKARVVTVTDKILSKVKRHQQHISLSFGCGDTTVNKISFSSVAKGKTGEKRRSKAEKTVTLQVLRQYFAGSLKEAAKSLGVCPTTLKRICRQHGIKRWPSRPIKKVGHNLQKLQHYIDSVQGASGAFHMSAMYPNFSETASPRSSGKSALLASYNRREIWEWWAEKYYSSHPIITKNTSPVAQDLDAQRVQVTYGDVKIRFRMQSKWRFKDLVHEIRRLFNIDDIAGFDLKYLDDDSEWVLLTCDADLEECIEVGGWSGGNTIKLLLQVSDRHLEQSSGSTAAS
ncbi:niemann-Pick C1 protein-like isoform X1 [Hibiscus syriacus]|uniref:Niemann-Pick C1 protein-like isoform X1 n=1 Tax=Hibiscus syriacus TaxID=106335 RepID=A0A6A2WDP0_HIBSY|nr:niemann-Pick C1 protein-like isoform X1 [Hibiscus syriacus]